MNTDRTTNSQSNGGPHLSEETLSEFTSGRLNDAERASVMRHADACLECAAALRDYAAMTNALKALPAPRPRRTFQLAEEQAKAKTRRWAFPSLLPTLPALRAATIAVAVLLLVVAGADRLTESDGNSSNSQRFAAMIAPSATAPVAVQTPANMNADVIAPTNQTTGAGSEQIDSGVASESESNSDQSIQSTADEASTNEAPAEVGAAAPAAAPNSASDGSGAASNHAAVAKAAASPETTAAPEPTATEVAIASPPPESTPPSAPALSTSNGGSDRTGWRVAELGLAMLLLWLVVSYVGVRRTAPNERNQ